jgi:dihydroflavonol-4-reductase
MKIAVTGANGHVGANLVRTLLAAKHEVRALCHAHRKGLDGLELEISDGDVLDPASLERAFDGVELVYHLAARINISPGDEDEVHAINVVGVRNVVAACLRMRVRRLLHFSSIHAFSKTPVDVPIDEARPLNDGRDVPPYDRSKAAGEREVQSGLQRGLDAVIVNPTAILGPFDYGPSRMGQVLLDLYHRRLPALVDGGFDWVDVRDVVSGAIAAAERAKAGEKFLLSGERRTVHELAAVAAELTGRRPPRFVSPMWLARVGAPIATAAARAIGKEPLFTSRSLHALRNHQLVSHTKATRELGYQPRPLRDTLQAAYDWFREAGQLD